MHSFSAKHRLHCLDPLRIQLMHTATDPNNATCVCRKAMHFESGQTKPFKQMIGAIDKVQAPEQILCRQQKNLHRTVYSFSPKITFIG